MLIDWFTVGAQALNFIILVWLMKRFLYKPVQDAIAAREKRIADQIAAAQALQADAEALGKDFRDRSAAFDAERAGLLAQATADANAQRERLIDEARQAADALAAKRRDALRTEAGQFKETMLAAARDEVFAITRKALADLADASLEARMADVFCRKLRELTDPAAAALAAALKAGPAVVRSGIELPEAQRAAVRAAIAARFPGSVAPRFETAQHGASGIELRAGGHSLAWSVDAYLASLEAAVSERLAAQVANDVSAAASREAHAGATPAAPTVPA
ncbi:MAG: F0F1 ATP synthase subunit B [Rhizobacter sp.]|nr:F0F1 ATP synthase subunit B [Rhizobacter sp.]